MIGRSQSSARTPAIFMYAHGRTGYVRVLFPFFLPGTCSGPRPLLGGRGDLRVGGTLFPASDSVRGSITGA